MTWDVAVVGAGAFGAFTAHHLRRAGLSVVLLEAHGVAHGRATSGGETRVIRMGYGPDTLYTRLAQASLPQWKELEARTGARLFVPSGVLWLARDEDPYSVATVAGLREHGVPFERLDASEIARRHPQMSCDGITWGIHEPEAGALMARRSVQVLVAELAAAGATVKLASVVPPAGSGRLAALETSAGPVAAGAFVLACGPWLPRLLGPELGPLLHVTRQELIVLGTPPGDRRFELGAMPVWIDFGELLYGIPDVEGRGFKAALHVEGAPFDPEDGDRTVAPEAARELWDRVGRRFPDLVAAPVIEARVCQYESTATGDLLVDRHPAFENLWVAGGGSGHGFKLAPAVGELVAGMVRGTAAPDPKLTFAAKAPSGRRTVL